MYEKFNIDKNINTVISYLIVSSFVITSHAVVNKSNSTLDVVLQSRCETFKVHSDYLYHTILPERPPLGDIPYKLILYDDLKIKNTRTTILDSEYSLIEKLILLTNLMTTTRTNTKKNKRKACTTNKTQNINQLNQHAAYFQQQYTYTRKQLITRHQTCKDMYKPDP